MIKNYQTQTKTKFISSHFKGVPELKNEYGSLNNLLKKVLTEPYNTQNVLSFEYIEDNIIRLILNVNHGFVKDQVIVLDKAEVEIFNKEYRVLATTLNSVDIIKPSEDLLSIVGDNLLNIAGAPLGYTVAYENIEEGVLCIKNGSVESPAILRSIDKLPPNNYDINWSKFARVTIGQYINNEGKFIDNIKAPYHPEHPYAEEIGNGIKGSSGIHGFAKWRYSLGNNYEPTETRTSSGIYPTRWRILGDDKTFYLMIHTTGLSESSYSFDLVGYGNYLSYNTEEVTNVCLQATDGFYPAESNPYYAPTRPRSFFGSLNYYYSGFILTDVYGSHKTGYNTVKNIGDYVDSTDPQFPWRQPSINTIHPTTNKMMTSKLIIKDVFNYIRGEHRGISNIYGTLYIPDSLVTSEGILFLEVQEPLNTSTIRKITMVFDLKDWEI